MAPNALSSNTAPTHSVPRHFPTVLVSLVGLWLAFELLVALGVIAQPGPIVGGTPTQSCMAAVLGSMVYLTVLVGLRQRRQLFWSDFEAPGAMVLLGVCAPGLAQLSAVLMPRTLISSKLDLPSAGLAGVGQAASQTPSSLHWVILIAVATVIAIDLAVRDSQSLGHQTNTIISAMLQTTAIAAAVCIFLPISSEAFMPQVGASSSRALLAAATAPSRLGAVSFPVLWLVSLTIGSFRATAGKSDRALRVLATASLVVVIILASFYEPKAIVAIPIAIVLGAIGQIRLGRLTAEVTSSSVTEPRTKGFSTADVGLISVFFMSGAAALVYQVVFAKGLALTFGSTSHASTIVLATYMSGLALGSWVGGKFAERVTRPILVYAAAELGIALICAFAPFTLKATRSLYVILAMGSDPAEPWLVGLQLGLGALVLIPPTLLMGVTMPMLTRHLLAKRESLGISAGVLYSSNTLGAAAGALITGYVLMPAFGVSTSLRIAVVLNVLVAAIAMTLGRGRRLEKLSLAETHRENAADLTSPVAALGLHKALGWIALAQLTVGGFVTFGLETTFVHLLATIAGNSAYAFSLMLFAFLIGLGIGSNVARRWIHDQRDFAGALLFCQAMLALSLLLGVPFWDAIPGYFAMFGSWAPAKSFAARELIRFLACLVVMLPPALFIGAQFPIAMDAIGRAWPGRRVAALGFASALNTMGNILGALVVGFILLPKAGSLGTLHLLIVACLLLAALSYPYVSRRSKPAVAALLLVEVVLYLKQPVEFDLSSLASGGNVYFQHQQYGRVIDSAESLDGGLTTVAISGEDREWSILTLLTNGKFQGDDSTGGEMKAQSSFSLAPLLHTKERNRALVIGFGTGTTTKVFHQAGFARIEVAELSGDILTLADRHFRAVNEGVLHAPAVHAHVTDGRNFLLLDKSKYDVISIELSSIWFAGAANLYNREFYQLVRARLAPAGVFQQWVQLHRLSEHDIATILTTLSEQFPNVWLYFLGKQGILVSCVERCLPSQQTLAALDQSPALASTLKLFDGHAGQVLKGRILTPETLGRLVSDAQRNLEPAHGSLIATDDNVTLEYSTPKGNVRPYDESLDQNIRYLERYKDNDFFAATALSAREQSYLGE